MRHTAGTGRSAATGCDRGRMLVFVALLALLFTALAAPYSDALWPGAGKCAAPAEAAAGVVNGPADRTCDPSTDVLTRSRGEAHHHGNGFRRLSHATAGHLRPHVPTGPNDKAVRESRVLGSLTAPEHAASWAVLPAAAGAPSGVTVLRC
ncbi:hypothetical protein ACFC0M_09560 [Streptomyces sp. NPDC056149]|uniref:hypothetical protein n=1 Tax=Streptomyces sp. NPDC056149 TaxID=3345728 RepID=UPI0035E3A06B